MAKQAARQLFYPWVESRSKAKRVLKTAEVEPDAIERTSAVVPKPRQIQEAGEVNISAYVPTGVKVSLGRVKEKTGYNVNASLAEALRDVFRPHYVPVSLELGKGR